MGFPFLENLGESVTQSSELKNKDLGDPGLACCLSSKTFTRAFPSEERLFPEYSFSRAVVLNLPNAVTL